MPREGSKLASSDIPTPLALGQLLKDKIDVLQLLQGRDEVRLVHRGTEYRLRVTRQGKLLLTK
jgi:hemin uptake protein HemP